MGAIPTIKLYGSEICHKTQYYKAELENAGLDYQFLDVVKNEDYAEELRGLYVNRKLNFPTITIGKKKLRNPRKEELDKWLNKLKLSNMDSIHDKNKKQFILKTNGENALVEYEIRDDKMYLIHSEVPKELQGQGIGKTLVLKTFEQLTKEGYKAVAVCSYVKAVASRSEKWNSIIEH